MYVVGARCFVLILYVTSPSVVMMHQVKKTELSKKPRNWKRNHQKKEHKMHIILFVVVPEQKHDALYEARAHATKMSAVQGYPAQRRVHATKAQPPSAW
jgi:hypothetical protein